VSENKGGRPKKEKKRTAIFSIRVTEEEKKKIEAMSEYYGKSVAEIARELLEKKHKEYVSESFFSRLNSDYDD